VKGLFALILSAGVLTPLLSFAQEPLDLERAIEYALAQNKQLVRSALAVDSSKLGVKSARTEFQISLRPAASSGLSQDNATRGVGLTASKKLIWGTELRMSGREMSDSGNGNLHRSSIQFEIEQPIFRNFGALIHGEATVKANQDLKTARRRFVMQKADLVVEVVKSYENIFRLEHLVRSDRESFKRMDALCKLTKAKELLGRTTRIDTLRVELLRGQVLSRLEANQKRLASEERNFAELLGFSPDSVFALKPTPALDFTVPELEEAVRVALHNRLDYAQVLQDYEDAHRSVRIARKKLLPDIKLILRHSRVGEGQSASDARRLDDNVWFFGITAGTDVNAGKERVALAQARIDEASASESIKIVELSIARQVQQHLLDYRRAQEETALSAQNLHLAQSRAKLARRLFELGRGENFSVTDAEEAFLQAENQLFAARAESSISGYRLFRVLGTLIDVSEEIKPKL
jgi:outer membrane protein TolC